MANEEIDELKAILTELIERRAELAYQVGNASNDDGLGKLATVQIAINALEAVIASNQPRKISSPGIMVP